MESYWRLAVPHKISTGESSFVLNWPNPHTNLADVEIKNSPDWFIVQCRTFNSIRSKVNDELVPITTFFFHGGINRLESDYSHNSYVSAMLINCNNNHFVCAYRNDMTSSLSPDSFTVVDDLFSDKYKSLESYMNPSNFICNILLTKGHYLAEAIDIDTPQMAKNRKNRCLSSACLAFVLRLPIPFWKTLRELQILDVDLFNLSESTSYIQRGLHIFTRAASKRDKDSNFKFNIKSSDVKTAHINSISLVCGLNDGDLADAEVCLNNILAELLGLSVIVNSIDYITQVQKNVLLPMASLQTHDNSIIQINAPYTLGLINQYLPLSTSVYINNV